MTALFFGIIFPAYSAEGDKKPLGISVETLGVIRYDDLSGPGTYGVGVDGGYQFNKYVIGHVRLISYETVTWRGTAIDEGSLLAEAKFLKSANGKLSLSGIGGVHRDFDRDDWGFGIGLRGTANVYKALSAFAGGEIRAWFDQPKDGLITVGLQLAF